MLGSTIALADSSGTIQTQYGYDAFGDTVASGASSTNPYQFTGRENDSTGLYFYRARYYSAAFQRFAAQDPIGLPSEDPNLYKFASEDPINVRDPLGLYGTGSCQYYTNACATLGDWYDCYLAPIACRDIFPNDPGSGSNCIRECLQEARDSHRPLPPNRCGPNPPPDNPLKDHVFCIWRCGLDVDNPYDPGGPTVPDNPTGPTY